MTYLVKWETAAGRGTTWADAEDRIGAVDIAIGRLRRAQLLRPEEEPALRLKVLAAPVRNAAAAAMVSMSGAGAVLDGRGVGL